MAEALLDCLLSTAEEIGAGDAVPGLKDADFLAKESNISESKQTKSDKSLVHQGDTDSSDDEDRRHFESAKYNDSGRTIKSLLGAPTPAHSVNQRQSTWKTKPPNQAVADKTNAFVDPFFGIRVVNPLVSSAALQERMSGREAVPMARLEAYLRMVTPQKDWVIAGVIVAKTSRTSQKGNQFAIWTLSDLHGDLKSVAVFLFGNAYKQLWKLTVGTVVGVLNPNVLEKNSDFKSLATLSVDNYQRVMVFGQSKDLGTCKSTKKNGERCTSFVNTNVCEHCVYHIKQEYQKCSGVRSELQSGFAGRGLTALRNKVLGKNEVFYAGKSYTAIPAAKSRKLIERDQGRLDLLSGIGPSLKPGTAPKSAPRRKQAVRLELSARQRARDMELMKRLGGGNSSLSDGKGNFSGKQSEDVTLAESKATALGVIAKLKQKDGKSDVAAPANNRECSNLEEQQVAAPTNSSNVQKQQVAAPTNNRESKVANVQQEVAAPTTNSSNTMATNAGPASVLGAKTIDLNSPISTKLMNRAKRNAIDWVKQNGAIAKVDPNKTKAEKRKSTNVENEPQPKRKPTEVYSSRFKQMMAATSKHLELLDRHDEDEKNKYFQKLEAKERMEEKMATTFKVACKAVRCLKCKYTSFSATERCKSERHPLRVYDATKRFYKCGNCGNRTTTLEVVPTEACRNCGGGKWERAAMMREKTVTAAHKLSIRGGEEKYVGSVATDANVDLLVPED